MRGLQDDGVVEDVGVAGGRRGDLAQARLPRGAVDGERRYGRQEILSGFSAEKSAEESSSLARTCCSVFTFSR
jgi:hypothetical protein